MKTVTVFVLLAFVIMGLEVAWAQKSPGKGEGAEGTLADSREGSEPSAKCGNGLAWKQRCPLMHFPWSKWEFTLHFPWSLSDWVGSDWKPWVKCRVLSIRTFAQQWDSTGSYGTNTHEWADGDLCEQRLLWDLLIRRERGLWLGRFLVLWDRADFGAGRTFC